MLKDFEGEIKVSKKWSTWLGQKRKKIDLRHTGNCRILGQSAIPVVFPAQTHKVGT